LKMLGLLALGALVASLLVTVATRQLGVLRASGTRVRRVAPDLARWSVGLVALGCTLYLGRGVLAGAARGSVASATGLEGLWSAWLIRVLVVTTGVMLAFGVIEWLLARAFVRQGWAQQQAAESGPKGANAR